MRNDPNDWSEDPRYIVDLLKRIVRVSVESARIIKILPPLNVPGARKERSGSAKGARGSFGGDAVAFPPATTGPSTTPENPSPNRNQMARRSGGSQTSLSHKSWIEPHTTMM